MRLPCPFCGSSQRLEMLNNGDPADTFYWIACDEDECGAEGPARQTEADAEAAWNKRHRSTLHIPVAK
jgi:Lar family restriction alleviation protein